jgi:transcriptional regulator with XRE-family HTH domain
MNKTSPSEFGVRLSDLRHDHVLTQVELVARIRTSVTTIMNWEAGRTVPGMWNILELCKVFKVSADWLIGTGIGK